MNKHQEYQEALDNVKAIEVESEECLYVCDLCEDDIKTLQEAVDKANKYDEKETPKKPIKIKLDYMETYVCPNCKHTFEGSSYCRFCGQALEVEDE